MLRIAAIFGPPPRVDLVTDILNEDPKATTASVAGVTAAVQVTATAGRYAVVWTLPRAASPFGYRIAALMSGPDIATARNQIDAVISSITYDPNAP